MAGSYATVALDVGAAVRPLIAATTLGTAVGNLGPLWASGLLVAVALLVAFAFRTLIACGRSTGMPGDTCERPPECRGTPKAQRTPPQSSHRPRGR